jgi:hypothetical protein
VEIRNLPNQHADRPSAPPPLAPIRSFVKLDSNELLTLRALIRFIRVE